MTMITPSYLGETIEYSSLHACRSTLEDPTPTYQWRKAGVVILGATRSTYTTPMTTMAGNGTSFDVVVTNAADSVTSIVVTLAVNAMALAPSITTQPASQTISAGQTATFMVALTGNVPFNYQWQKNGGDIPGATSSSYTTPPTTISDNGAQFTILVTNGVGNAQSNAATLTVNPTQTVDVLTYHNDIARTGQNVSETILIPPNVSATTFGKLGFFSADGRIDAQPLYLSSVAIPQKGTHDVVYVATEHDSVYAFDSATGEVLWHTSVLGPGETPSDDHGCGQVTPEIGITSTPVIDRTFGSNGAIYVIAMSKDGTGNYFQRLHALDITTGVELSSSPTTIHATYPGAGANSDGQNVVFDPARYKERAGLLLLNSTIYTSWASHCDQGPYTGWIIGLDQASLAISSVLNVTPNGGDGAIWMSGGGLAGDANGNIYALDGNGTFDSTLDGKGFPIQGDYGNAFLKLSTVGGLSVSDYFEMSNQGVENSHDVDLGSGGAMLLPDLTDATGNMQHLAVGAGKDQNLYVVNRDAMSKFDPNTNHVYQELTGIFPGGIFSSPAYFNNNIYFGSVGNPIASFAVNNATLSNSPLSQTSIPFGYPGATPAISANGSANGILWAIENGSTAAVLHAYDAMNLATELYNSNQATGSRDSFGPGNKFMTPTIANGRVYVGTPNGVAVFGLLPSFTTTLTLPSITTQPISQQIGIGQTAAFGVVAAGTSPLTYQWQKNGINISGATLSTYTTPPATALDDGSQFTVVISNAAGSAFSLAATLTLDLPPSITGQPISQTVVAGEIATFTVVSNGALPLSYQWQKNGINIPGAVSSAYTTPVTSLLDNGEQVDVIVTNPFGSQPSVTVFLTIIQPASPATYYIDFDSGLDTNNGVSPNAPWQHAPGMRGCVANCTTVPLNPGDRFIFKGGVTWDASSFPWTVTTSGSFGNSVYYGVDKAWFAGNTWTRPVFDLDNATWSVAPVLIDSANFVTFDNLEITNEAVDNSGGWPPRSSISVNGGSNITIQNCYIHGWSIQNPGVGSDLSPSGGIAFYYGSVGGAVKNCVLNGSPENNSGTGIYGGTTIQGNIVENVPNGIVINDSGADVSGNQIFEVPYSVDPNTISNAIVVNASGNIYNNIVHDLVPGAFAIVLESGPSEFEFGNIQSVYNNLVWNVGDSAAIIVDAQNLGPVSLSTQSVYNNTLVAGTTGCISVLPNFYPPTNLAVENNHCISDQPGHQAWCWNNAGGNFDCGLVTNVTFANNILMKTSKATSEGYILSSSFQPISPDVDTVAAGLNLTSSCVPIGSSLCSDRLGALRPGSGPFWDVGAYTYQTAVVLLPGITSQPVREAVAAGQSATFSVIATGTGTLTYQWRENGANISGATSASYTTPLTSVADDETIFTVTVSNSAGTATSSPAVLSVNDIPGQLTANSTSLNFGVVNVGSTNASNVTITNSSNFYVTISSVSVSGPGFNASGVPSGLILAPQETATLNIVFAPAGTGNAFGSVTINSDAVGSPMTIPLSGTAVLHAVNLTWTPSPSEVFGYYVYRADDRLGPYVIRLTDLPVTITNFTDTAIVAGETYTYWVVSVQSDTLQSSFSEPVTATIPSP